MKRQDVVVSRLRHAAAAAPLSEGNSCSPVIEPKIATMVVSPGDTLWRISRVTYGAARDIRSFTKQTGSGSEIQIVYFPGRSLSFP